ncbi:DsrS [hydrothermal vent metagenome]|uniref:DsrS n=1 Tax=hydrothermal vent metagenome TaxID=652676 RepID=A0A1W1CW12_9ZZZZ
MLSTEDTFKLNVLIANSIAIRIDTYKMCVYGLTSEGEEKELQLNHNDNHDKYITATQTLLLNKVLGTMGGYPSYLKRWSRMGEVSTKNLNELLMLGNIEAVIAVVNVKELNNDIIKKSWWCATNTDYQAEIGRYLLKKDYVVKTEIGKEIAQYLFEFLPFIEDTTELMDTIFLILNDDLLTTEQKQSLLKQGMRKSTILCGFLERNLVDSFAETAIKILKKINNEFVLYRVLNAIGKYYHHPMIMPLETIEKLQQQIENINTTDEKTRLFLAGVSEKLVVSEIAANTLAGSNIRKQLKPILEPIIKKLNEIKI